MSSPNTQRRSPYQGLIPYFEQDAPFFFGREKEARLIIANMFASPLTLLYGASGVGKSSVLRAGVAHNLRDREDLLVLVFNAWQGNPLSNLKARIADAAERVGVKITPPSGSTSLLDYLTEYSTKLNRRLMVILDQFEEYFLYHPQEDDFAIEFSKAVTQSEAPLSFLISIREDFYAKLDRFEGRIPALYDNYLRIEHLGRDSARVAIEAPIAEYNRLYTTPGDRFSIEPALVEAILSQVQTGRVVLGEAGRGVIETVKGTNEIEVQIETPFLQLVMTRLWDEEVEGRSRELQRSTLDRLGGAENIVRTHLDAVMKTLLPREQEIAAGIFHYLVTPSGTKIAYTASDLAVSAELTESEVVHALDKLSYGDVRILRTIDPGLEHPTAQKYEIFHDVLAAAILAWRAGYVQEQERAETDRQLKREAEERAKAERQLERERMLARRLRWALVGLIALILAMGGLTVYAFQQRAVATGAIIDAKQQRDAAVAQKVEADFQRDNAQKAEMFADKQRYLAESAVKDSQKQRDIAKQAAATAKAAQQKEADQRKETESALITARKNLDAKNRAEAARSQQEEIGKLRLDAEAAKSRLEFRPMESMRQARDVFDRLLALGVPDVETSNKAEDVLRRALLSLDEFHTTSELRAHNDSVEGAYFSPDGDLLITAGDESFARVWNTSNWLEIAKWAQGEPIRKVVFNNDGSYFLTISGDDTVWVWDRRSLSAPVQQLKAQFATFSADGKSVLLTNGKGSLQRWVPGTSAPIDVDRPSPMATSRRATVSESTWLSPRGIVAVASTESEGIQVWEVGTKRPPIKSSEITLPVEDVFFSEDEKSLTFVSKEHVQVLDISKWLMAPLTLVAASEQTGSQPAPSATPTAEPTPTPTPEYVPITLPNSGKSAVTSIQFNPEDRNRLITFSADGTTMYWEVNSRKSYQVLQGQSADVIKAVYSPDGEYVVLLSSRGNVRVWNIAKRAVFATLRGHSGPVLAATFSPRDGSLVTSSYDKTVRVWEWKPKTWRANPVILSVRNLWKPSNADKDIGPDLADFTDIVSSLINRANQTKVALSDDGRYVMATDTTAARIWQAGGDNKSVAEFSGDKLEFSADGRLVAIADRDTVLQWTDTSTEKPTLELNVRIGAVRGASFSSDGRYVLTTSADKVPRVWDVKTGTVVVLGGPTEVIVAASFNPDGTQVSTIGTDGTFRVWQWQSPEGRRAPFIMKTTSSVRVAAFSPNGSFIATTSGQGAVTIWEVRTDKPLTRMTGFKGRIQYVVFSPDSKRILAMEDYGAYVLDLTSAVGATSQGTYLIDKRDPTWTKGLPARGAAFSPDGRFVLTGGGNVLQLWDVATARAPRRIAFANIARGRISSIAYSPKGNYIAASISVDSKNAVVDVWKVPATNSADLDLGSNATVLRDLKPYSVAAGDVGIIFSVDEKVIMMPDGNTRTAVWAWQSDAGTKRPVIVPGRVAALSPDGKLVFSSRLREVVRVQSATEISQGAPLVLREIDSTIETLAFSRNGDLVAVVVPRVENEDVLEEVLLWDAKSGVRRHSIRLPKGRDVSRMVFSADSQWLAIASMNTLLLYNTKDGKAVPLPNREDDQIGSHRGDINDVEFSLDSKYIVTASDDRTARIWDITAGKAVALLRGHFGVVTSAVFSSNGEFIVTASADKTALVWHWTPPAISGDMATVDPDPVRLEGHAGPVLAAAIDRENRFVVTGSADNTARLWNARTGQVLAELVGHTTDVLGVKLSSDGKVIVTIGADGTVEVYSCQECGPVDELLAEAGGRK